MEKIKAFFQNKITKIVSWLVLSLCVIALIVGGATTESISNGIALVGGIVAAVAALVAFITGQIKK